MSFQGFLFGNQRLPILYTQFSNQDQPGNAVATSANEIRVAVGGNTYVGFRNQKSFRFLGIPYVNPPKRFVDSTPYPYSPMGQTILKKGSTQGRPVMFRIHGGGFTGGPGADPGSYGAILLLEKTLWWSIPITDSPHFRSSRFQGQTLKGTLVLEIKSMLLRLVAQAWGV
jgi:hypothetical protein